LRRIVVPLVVLAVFSGCIRASFTKTVPEFVPHAADTAPTVFVDRLPSRPYESVGIIRVEGPLTELSSIIDVAQRKGKDLGCDILVLRSIHRVTRADAPSDTVTARPLVAVFTPGSPSPIAPVSPAPAPPLTTTSTLLTMQPPSEDRDFICGMYVAAAAPAPSAPPPAPSAAAPGDAGDP
jgi:hypothetical protein